MPPWPRPPPSRQPSGRLQSGAGASARRQKPRRAAPARRSARARRETPRKAATASPTRPRCTARPQSCGASARARPRTQDGLPPGLCRGADEHSAAHDEKVCDYSRKRARLRGREGQARPRGREGERAHHGVRRGCVRRTGLGAGVAWVRLWLRLAAQVCSEAQTRRRNSWGAWQLCRRCRYSGSQRRRRFAHSGAECGTSSRAIEPRGECDLCDEFKLNSEAHEV